MLRRCLNLLIMLTLCVLTARTGVVRAEDGAMDEGALQEIRGRVEAAVRAAAHAGGRDSERFSGTVLVARNGCPVFEGAFGMADRANKVLNINATRFNLGSINKSFTQVAIGQLAAQGKLAYEDTLGALIPDYPQDVARSATVDQLLNHTAGIADIFGDEFFRGAKDRFRSNADFYRLVSARPPTFPPGAGNQYCNGCYVVLGAIIERVSGLPYETYMAQHVFTPAGMAATGYPQADGIEPRIAHGYTRPPMGGPLRDAIFLHGAAGSAAGDSFASAADLLAYDNALRERRLLDENGLARLLRIQGGTSGGRVQGLYRVGGGAPGVNTTLQSDGEWTVVVLANQDPPAADDVANAITSVLPGWGQP